MFRDETRRKLDPAAAARRFTGLNAFTRAKGLMKRNLLHFAQTRRKHDQRRDDHDSFHLQRRWRSDGEPQERVASGVRETAFEITLLQNYIKKIKMIDSEIRPDLNKCLILQCLFIKAATGNIRQQSKCFSILQHRE